MSYLSYHRLRRDEWKAHDSFPSGAVRYWRDCRYVWREKYGTEPLLIFTVSQDHTKITLIPEEEWPDA